MCRVFINPTSSSLRKDRLIVASLKQVSSINVLIEGKSTPLLLCHASHDSTAFAVGSILSFRIALMDSILMIAIYKNRPVQRLSGNAVILTE